MDYNSWTITYNHRFVKKNIFQVASISTLFGLELSFYDAVQLTMLKLIDLSAFYFYICVFMMQYLAVQMQIFKIKFD